MKARPEYSLLCLQISREDAQAFARENRIHYMEASAKNRYNVDEAFLELVQIIRYSPVFCLHFSLLHLLNSSLLFSHIAFFMFFFMSKPERYSGLSTSQGFRPKIALH